MTLNNTSFDHSVQTWIRLERNRRERKEGSANLGCLRERQIPPSPGEVSEARYKTENHPATGVDGDGIGQTIAKHLS